MAFAKAIEGGVATWQELVDRLAAWLEPVQHPSILLPLIPADFGLAPQNMLVV